MNGLYDVDREMFFKLDVSGRRGHNMKPFKKDLDWMSGNLSLVTELLIVGMYCHSVVLIVTLLTLLKKYRT